MLRCDAAFFKCEIEKITSKTKAVTSVIIFNPFKTLYL